MRVIKIIIIQMKSNKSIEGGTISDIKFTELPYNHEQTLKLENDPIYNRYKKWLKDNGVLIDQRIRFPSYFGEANNGIIGVSAIKPIERKKAVIAVPYDLLITVDKVKSVEELNVILKENPNLFKSEDDSVMRMLILYMSYELLKGEKSFYFPYFQISKNDILHAWDHWTLQGFENRQVMGKMKAQQEEVELNFMNFLRIYRRYENVFPQGLANADYKKIYERAYSFICTRAFGWSLPSISLIPMGDSLNHGNFNYVDHYLVNIDEEKAIPKENQASPYQRYCKKANLTLLKDQYFNLNQAQLDNLRKEKKSKAYRFVQKHKSLLESSQKLIGSIKQIGSNKGKDFIRQRQNRILHQQYKAGIHKVNKLHFYDSSCSQDNDSDQDEIFEFAHQRQKFEIYDRLRNINEANKKKEIKKYWSLYMDNSEEEMEEEESEELSLASQKQTLKKELKENLEKENQSSSMSSESSSEADQNFDWFTTESPPKTYFIMQTKNIIRENQQIYNFYGRRSNKFLLVGYNFVMEDNIYDSFSLKLKFDDSISVKAPATKIIWQGKNKKNSGLTSKQIRLKRNRINIDLINHARSYLILWQKKTYPNQKILTAFDKQFQGRVLGFYQQIIRSIIKEYTTSLQEDEDLLQAAAKYQQRTAIKLRIEYKKILDAQQLLISKCISFLQKWKGGSIQTFQQSDMNWVRRVRCYLEQLQRSSLA